MIFNCTPKTGSSISAQLWLKLKNGFGWSSFFWVSFRRGEPLWYCRNSASMICCLIGIQSYTSGIVHLKLSHGAIVIYNCLCCSATFRLRVKIVVKLLNILFFKDHVTNSSKLKIEQKKKKINSFTCSFCVICIVLYRP
jgi:hypothetical protein